MEQLYKNIKNRREELGMSQNELAAKIGYTTRSSVNKIEKGLVNLPYQKIVLFAHALQTTPSELTGWSRSELESRFLESYQELSDSEKNIINGLISEFLKSK